MWQKTCSLNDESMTVNTKLSYVYVCMYDVIANCTDMVDGLQKLDPQSKLNLCVAVIVSYPKTESKRPKYYHDR